MPSELIKYTLDELEYIDKILEAFCDKTTYYNVLILDIDVRFNTTSESKIQKLKEKGYELDVKSKCKYEAKKVISNVPVDITASGKGKTNHDYKKGIQIEVACTGSTYRELEKDKERKEKAILKYLNKYGIPLNRLCVGSSLRCEYKFSGIICESGN